MYADSTGQFTCKACPINQYFDESTKACVAMSDPTGLGYGMMHPMYAKEQCTYGHYSDATSVDSLDARDCLPCDAGYACEDGETSATPAGKECPNGFWCNANDEMTPAYTMHPCPPGYKANGGTGHGTMSSACAICS